LFSYVLPGSVQSSSSEAAAMSFAASGEPEESPAGEGASARGEAAEAAGDSVLAALAACDVLALDEHAASARVRSMATAVARKTGAARKMFSQ
jgi:hypothetical protein